MAGGVGGGKFARGLAAVLPPDQLAIVVNTADDFVHLGLHISPDVDSVLYALADRNDPERGWGLAGETWNFMAAMERLGGETWFKLGDRDLATHVLRTRGAGARAARCRRSRRCSRAASASRTRSLPMSDDPVRSIVETDEGALDFQDYFVRRQCKPKFRGVTFQGAAQAKARAKDFAMRSAARAPSSSRRPIHSSASIPILALPGIKDALRQSRRPVIAVSPIVGGKAVKGPLAKMMSELGVEPSALGVARHYGQLVDGWMIDRVDRDLAPAIEALGCRVKVCDTIMRTLDDKSRLAQDAIELAFEMATEACGIA